MLSTCLGFLLLLGDTTLRAEFMERTGAMRVPHDPTMWRSLWKDLIQPRMKAFVTSSVSPSQAMRNTLLTTDQQLNTYKASRCCSNAYLYRLAHDLENSREHGLQECFRVRPSEKWMLASVDGCLTCASFAHGFPYMVCGLPHLFCYVSCRPSCVMFQPGRGGADIGGLWQQCVHVKVLDSAHHYALGVCGQFAH